MRVLWLAHWQAGTTEVIYEGRHIDVLALWGQYIDLPRNISDPLPTFLNKVVCPNPSHNTNKAHFQVNTKKPLVHCFADCGISGTYEHAISVITGCTEKEARRAILKESRVALAGELPTKFGDGQRKTIGFDDELAKDERALDGGAYHYTPTVARKFLDKRGVDGASRGKWRIGWDEDAERLVIPAYDERGILRFLIRQRIDGIKAAKYLYTPGAIKTNLLFGACYLDRERLHSLGLILCEGPLDAIRLQQLGFPAVAILGTGISKKQVRLVDKLGPKRVFLMFDKDDSGVDNILKVVNGTLAHRGIKKTPLRICRYPRGKSDPAEMTRQEVERSLERAVSVFEFNRLSRKVSRHAFV